MDRLKNLDTDDRVWVSNVIVRNSEEEHGWKKILEEVMAEIFWNWWMISMLRFRMPSVSPAENEKKSALRHIIEEW